jgi:hypothetical protein
VASLGLVKSSALPRRALQFAARSDRIAALPSQFARAVARELPLNLYRLPIEVQVPEISMF